eukprot:TRINITY_DN35990_c0_g1_i1.p1 TRINITY_DN35990_c0_g1~~TRINITY_DN35990_c0_g1_i1.p1  ORF type:complete len:514 (+),score=102.81 TRINITY_DN35990_c0_g1_i1:61-1542(+)
MANGGCASGGGFGGCGVDSFLQTEVLHGHVRVEGVFTGTVTTPTGKFEVDLPLNNEVLLEALRPALLAFSPLGNQTADGQDSSPRRVGGPDIAAGSANRRLYQTKTIPEEAAEQKREESLRRLWEELIGNVSQNDLERRNEGTPGVGTSEHANGKAVEASPCVFDMAHGDQDDVEDQYGLGWCKDELQEKLQSAQSGLPHSSRRVESAQMVSTADASQALQRFSGLPIQLETGQVCQLCVRAQNEVRELKALNATLHAYFVEAESKAQRVSEMLRRLPLDVVQQPVASMLPTESMLVKTSRRKIEEDPSVVATAARIKQELGRRNHIGILPGKAIGYGAKGAVIGLINEFVGKAHGKGAAILTTGNSAFQILFVKASVHTDATVVHLVPAGCRSGQSHGRDIEAGANEEECLKVLRLLGDLYITYDGEHSFSRAAKIVGASKWQGADEGATTPCVRNWHLTAVPGFYYLEADHIEEPLEKEAKAQGLSETHKF